MCEGQKGRDMEEVMKEVPSLVETLGKIASSAVTGAIVSFLAERSGLFQNLEPKVKQAVVFVVSLGLPLGAFLLLQYVPADVWAALEPYWQVLAAGFLVWLGSQVTHAIRKLTNNKQ